MVIIVGRHFVALGIRSKNATNDDPSAAPSADGNIANKEWAGGSMLRGSLRGGLKTNPIRNGAVPGMFAFGALALACLAGPAQADGDAAKGKTAFVRQCAICHTSEKGG